MMYRPNSRTCSETRGYTLVEVMVSFALTALLLAAASLFFIRSLNLHYRMKSMSDGISVSEILLDKMADEIAEAKNSGHKNSTIVVAEQGSTGCPAIILTVRSGNRIEITRTAEEGNPYLLLHFYPTKENPQGNLWTFDEKLYQGYVIEALDFEQLAKEDGMDTNIIKIQLTIRSPSTGFSCSRSRCVPCWQFVTEEDISRITEAGSSPE